MTHKSGLLFMLLLSMFSIVGQHIFLKTNVAAAAEQMTSPEPSTLRRQPIMIRRQSRNNSALGDMCLVFRPIRFI